MPKSYHIRVGFGNVDKMARILDNLTKCIDLFNPKIDFWVKIWLNNNVFE